MPTKRLIPEMIACDPAAWRGLTTQQRSFLIDYIAHGVANDQYDAVAAARAAYPQVKATRVWASRLMSNARIKRHIALHLGRSDAEMLLADIQALIKRSRRRGANLDLLVAPWLRVAKALEVFIAKETPR